MATQNLWLSQSSSDIQQYWSDLGLNLFIQTLRKEVSIQHSSGLLSKGFTHLHLKVVRLFVQTLKYRKGVLSVQTLRWGEGALIPKVRGALILTLSYRRTHQTKSGWQPRGREGGQLTRPRGRGRGQSSIPWGREGGQLSRPWGKGGGQLSRPRGREGGSHPDLEAGKGGSYPGLEVGEGGQSSRPRGRGGGQSSRPRGREGGSLPDLKPEVRGRVSHPDFEGVLNK